MKKIWTLLIALCVSTFAISQTNANVTNPSFENWTDQVIYDSLELWNSSAAQMYAMGEPPNTWQDDVDPQDGFYSVFMETAFVYNTVTFMDDTIFGYVIKESAGAGFEGFPYSDTLDQMSFWYKCDVQAGDSAIAIVQLMKAGAVYAQAQYSMGGTTSAWTQVALPIAFASTEEPDSVFIGFASSDPFTPGVPKEGSILEIDNVTFEFTAGSTIPSAIPNYSFEDLFELTLSMPDVWYSLDDLLYLNTGEAYVVESPSSTSGTSSIEITTTLGNVVFSMPALVTNGTFDFGTGIPIGGDAFIAQPAEMLLDFQYAPSGTDTALCWLQIWNGTSGMLIDTFVIYTNTVSAWETDTIELSFTEAPDSINVLLYSGDFMGSVFMVDNIRFEGGDVGINTIYLSDKWNVFPNPAGETATVLFNQADKISVINLAGQVIYHNTSLNGSTIQLNTADWDDGIYLIQLTNKGKVETKKLIVTH
ncbi:T9SS type A sorting domain-containing protein [Crocinitomix catalasitica]|nr:T9SS type A sorting domain-containing protein [Crocinitomix catalasitica]